MADVKIIDIDSEQWNIKDQKARNDISVLQEKTTITTEQLWKSDESFINKVKINGEYFLQVHCSRLGYIGTAVTHLLDLPGAIGNTVTLRCQLMGDFQTHTDRISVNLDFNPDGTVLAIVLNQGFYEGGNFTVYIYGDALIKII